MGTYTTAEVKTTEGKGWEVIDNRPATPGYKKQKYEEARQSITNVLSFLNIDIENQKLLLTFEGDLYAASGVGASAAQCTSLARALNDEFNLELDDEMINKAAYEGEKGYHGTPSGIDNTVSTYGGLIWFEKNLSGGKNQMDKLKSKNKMFLVIGNTGETASTTEVVKDVKKLKEENPDKFEKIFENYKDLAIDAKKALIESDVKTIGHLMNKNHELLQEITVSGKINDLIVKLARDNGALGAKMTGTGRGGLVIALASDKDTQEKISNTIQKNGYMAWKTTIG
ncbi:MAG: mevalonate kinase [Candidatus Lokiarchaeota archaeon]|nr:mevalonate kinase [Candidatus Lokiarchaeota archaeon]